MELSVTEEPPEKSRLRIRNKASMSKKEGQKSRFSWILMVLEAFRGLDMYMGPRDDRYDPWDELIPGYGPAETPDFLGFPWISLILSRFSWFYKDFDGFESISKDSLDDHSRWPLRWADSCIWAGWDSWFPWISLDFLDFESILIGFSWFYKDFDGFEMILMADSWIWACLRAEMIRFPCFPGYVLSESPIWADSWIWDDLMALKTRFPGFWWFWTPDTGFWWFRKLSDPCFEMIFLLSGCFWDDFACWLPGFALYIRWFWPFPGFLMLLGSIFRILRVFLCLGPFWKLFSEYFKEF